MDDLVQLEENLAQHGSTSFPSSLATTISVIEDTDDLHLGAEAVSFDFAITSQPELSQLQIPTAVNSENYGSKRRRSLRHSLIVMKELSSSFESTDTNRTYSSISSVVDLLQAREGDADDLLTGLGFDFTSEIFERRSILSRFEPPPLPHDEPNRVLDTFFPDVQTEEIDDGDDQPEYHEGISKAKEWLDLHHMEDNDSTMKSLQSKQTTTDQADAASLKQSKPVLPRTHKLRRKFSKSRQSSFELLLPKLKEEDVSPEGQSLAKNETCQLAITPCSPIREISMERATVENTVLNNANDKQQISHGNSSMDISSTEDLDREVKEKLTIEKSDPLDSTLLVTNQLESFELEEINSNNGDALERPTVAATSPSGKSIQPRSVDQSLMGSQASEHGSDGNESSSGFEEEDNMASGSTFETKVKTCKKVKTQLAAESIEVECSCAVSVPQPIEPQEISSENLPNSNCDDNRNNNLSINKKIFAQVRSEKLGALSTNYIPLRCVTPFQGAHVTSNSCIVTPMSAVSDQPASKNFIAFGKYSRLISDVRRRRKEFANRCAVSGDRLRDLCYSSSLIRSNGGFVVRKRRPGQFHYYGNVSEIQENRAKLLVGCRDGQGNQSVKKSPVRQQSFDGNSERASKHTAGYWGKRVFRSFSTSAVLGSPEMRDQTLTKIDSSLMRDKRNASAASSKLSCKKNNEDRKFSQPRLAANRNNNNDNDTLECLKCVVPQRSLTSSTPVESSQCAHLSHV